MARDLEELAMQVESVKAGARSRHVNNVGLRETAHAIEFLANALLAILPEIERIRLQQDSFETSLASLAKTIQRNKRPDTI
jgi:hypothetical protein